MSNYRFNDEGGKHLHELGGKPLLGTSTVVGVLAKPLTWWASGLAVAELGWIRPLELRKKPLEDEIEKNDYERKQSALAMLEKFSGMTPDEYMGLLDKAYKAHAEKLTTSADKGTDMHAKLEKYIKASIEYGRPMTAIAPFVPQVEIFAEWALKNVKRFIVSEGHCYSKRLWVGGITDCVAELNDGKLAIIDFKSSKEAYLSQAIQIAGYDIEMSENGLFDGDGNLIGGQLEIGREIDCYAVFPFGADEVEPAMFYDTMGLKAGFESCVQLYKLINGK